MASRVLVTGATGFVGANVVRELRADGESVRVLVRPRSDRRNLDGLDVEVAEGDLRDPDSLRRGLEGVRILYHVAADYRLWARDPRDLYSSNVEGTRNILAAARDAGVERVVYTSSVGTLGIPNDGRPGTETTPVHLDQMVGPYKRSKFLAEREAERFVREGLDVVIVNPSAPVGPWDRKPTPTGRMIVDYLRGRMFASLDTGLNLIHVRDCARGHILAARKGRSGEKYILGCQNLRLGEIFALLANLTGIREPRLRIPYAVAWMTAAVSETWARLSGREPAVPLTAVRMAAKTMFFDPAKAVRELGLPQTPPEAALEDAVEWFRTHGLAPRDTH